MRSINKNAPKRVTKEHLDKAVEYYEKNKTKSPPPKAKEIIQYAANAEIDARSSFGKDLMLKLEEFGINPFRSHQYSPMNVVVLTEEQEEFIRGNACRVKWFDCARQLFPEVNNMNPASLEARAVRLFYDTLPENLKIQEEEIVDKKYSAPRTLDRAMSRVNKYILDGINREKITNAQKTGVMTLIKYLNGHRFINQINSYSKVEERDAFEDCFVRYTYDKPDLTQEEIDQYILLSAEVVIGFKNQRRVEMLQVTLEEATDTNNDDGNSQLTIKLVEAVNSAQGEYNQCVKRQNDLINHLKGKRAERISKRVNNIGSFADIIDAWKAEETRIKMIRFAEMKRTRLKESLKEYSTMDDMKAEIYGLTEDEVLDG